MLLSNQVRDTGRILENVVFLELVRRFGSVYVGRIGDLEVDFVVEGDKGTAYFQVAESIPNDKVLERELAPLKRIEDNYPKYLLTLNDADPIDHEGIMQINALDWMLGNDRL